MMKTRWITTTLIGAAGILAAGVLLHKSAKSADHTDSPATKADATIDINDVFSWMDGNNVVLAMTVFPLATTTSVFSNTAQYVLHTSNNTSYTTTSAGTTDNFDIICTFAGTTAPQTLSCWGGTTEFVTGQTNVAAGITSTDGKFKVFAGNRADPFFFNLDGFHATEALVEGAASGLTFNDAGCPALNAGTVTALDNQLKQAPDGGAPADFFQTLNTLAIVVSIDKSLVTTTGPIVAVWASTHK